MFDIKLVDTVGFSGSLILSIIFTYFCIKIAKKYKIIDEPNPRKIHKKPVPYLGGVAIYLSFIVILFISSAMFEVFSIYTKSMVGLLVSSFIIFLLGLYDDLKGSNAIIKLIFQILAAVVLIKFGYIIDRITSPFGGVYYFSPVISTVITIFWIVGIMNAINLLDGLDGLAGGVIVIASIFLFIIANVSGNINVEILSIILVGSTLGFLIFNFPPAKIFMGDTGSMFLGLIFAIMAISGNRKSAVAINLLIPVVLLTLPIIDTILAIIRRTKKNKNIFQADKEHIHHRLLSLGIPYKKAIILIYLFCVYLGFVSLLSLHIEKESVFIILIIIGINILVGLYVLHLIENNIVNKNIKE